jgi:hypothetical protein
VKSLVIKPILQGRWTVLWTLPEEPVAQTEEWHSRHGVLVHITATGDQVWDAPLPNAPRGLVHPWLQMRGLTPALGYRITKNRSETE